ncbi:MAG: hypothetical protein R3F60_17310 [bacterium]
MDPHRPLIRRRRSGLALALAAALAGCEASNQAVAPPPPAVAADPVVTLLAPAEGAVVESGFEVVAQIAGADALRIEVTGQDDRVVRADAAGRVAVLVRAVPGPIVVSARAADGRGEAASRPVFVARRVTLGAPPAPTSVTLRLDRDALASLLTPAEQARVPLVEVDLAPLVHAALAALLDPEAAGRGRFGVGAAERNLVRLLGNTPASTDPTGTALGPVLALGGAGAAARSHPRGFAGDRARRAHPGRRGAGPDAARRSDRVPPGAGGPGRSPPARRDPRRRPRRSGAARRALRPVGRAPGLPGRAADGRAAHAGLRAGGGGRGARDPCCGHRRPGPVRDPPGPAR